MPDPVAVMEDRGREWVQSSAAAPDISTGQGPLICRRQEGDRDPLKGPLIPFSCLQVVSYDRHLELDREESRSNLPTASSTAPAIRASRSPPCHPAGAFQFYP